MKMPHLLNLYPHEWEQGDLVITPSTDHLSAVHGHEPRLYKVTSANRTDEQVWAVDRLNHLQIFDARPWHGYRQWLVIRGYKD